MAARRGRCTDKDGTRQRNVGTRRVEGEPPGRGGFGLASFYSVFSLSHDSPLTPRRCNEAIQSLETHESGVTSRSGVT